MRSWVTSRQTTEGPTSMPGSRLNVHLFRDSFNTPWGFRLQGGKDLHQPLIVQRVFSNSPAEGELQRGDVILSINNRDAGELTHKHAQDLIKHCGGQVQLVVNRPPPGVSLGPLSPPIITHQPRAPVLHPVHSSHAGGHGFQPTKVTLNKFGGGGRDLGSDFSQRTLERCEPRHDKHDMLSRVQNSLDNITLSPRSPEVHTSSPFYQPYSPPYQPSQQPYSPPYQPSQQPYSPPYQPPQQLYTPTGLLLEQQQQQQQQQDQGEALPPVWERRKLFQQSPVQRPGHTPGYKSAPKVPKPQPGPSSYGNFGIDYTHPTTKQPQAGWRPAPQFHPSQAPAKTPQYKPNYAPPPTAAKPVSPSSYASVHAAPPPWQRTQEEGNRGTPAWRSSLKATGVKPWDTDVGYTNEQAPIRSVPYAPAPMKSPVASGPFSPSGAPSGGSENGPKVVHLQYNSPLHLYSNQNVAETLKGQTQAMAGQPHQGPAPVNDAGERDWSQSAVLRFISQEESKRGKQPAPSVSPKPQYSPIQSVRPVQPFYQAHGATEF